MDRYLSLDKQKKNGYAVFFSALLLFICSKSVNAHEGAACEGEGPYGVPGLTLPPDQIGQWGSVINFPVQATHSVVLSTGKVLFWRTDQPYLFDPATDTYAATTQYITPTGDMFCAGHATMADGRVMVSGGDNFSSLGIPYSEIFDPVTETWQAVSDSIYARYYPTITTMLDGRLLMTSGNTPDGPATIPEIYDPDTDTWTEFPNASRGLNLYPFMYALSDGTVLDAGPGHAHTLDVASADSAWNFVTPNILLTNGSVETSAMYRPDKILKVGSKSDATQQIINRAVVLDMTAASPAWREVSPMVFERRRADAVLLPDGKVMISGGAVDTEDRHECAVHAAEIWDPDTEVFTQMASQALSRIYHSTSVLLPDGRVLTAGGEDAYGEGGLHTAEIYSPPYLFKGIRPTIVSMSTAAGYGADFQLTTPDAASIVSVAALRPAALTHNFDENQRYLPLNFTIGAGQLTVTAPAANLTPPGYYMVFLVDSNGSVSVSKFIRFFLDTDTDGDGVDDDVDNCPLIANPLQENNDGDAEGDVCDADDDNDGLSDVDEVSYGTDAFNPDTDGDNLSDGDEVYTHGTNPLLADTDADGYDDDVEIAAGSDPTNPASTPFSIDGDVNIDGIVDVRDLVLLSKFIFGLAVPNADQLVHADVAPLVSGYPVSDGQLNAADFIVLTRKVLGIISF